MSTYAPEVDLSHLGESRTRPRVFEVVTIPDPVPAYYCQLCGARLSRYNDGATCWPCEDRIEREQLRAPDRVSPDDDLESVRAVIVKHFGSISECEAAIGTSCLVGRLRTGNTLTAYMADRINIAIATDCRARLRWLQRGEVDTTTRRRPYKRHEAPGEGPRTHTDSVAEGAT